MLSACVVAITVRCMSHTSSDRSTKSAKMSQIFCISRLHFVHNENWTLTRATSTVPGLRPFLAACMPLRLCQPACLPAWLSLKSGGGSRKGTYGGGGSCSGGGAATLEMSLSSLANLPTRRPRRRGTIMKDEEAERITRAVSKSALSAHSMAFEVEARRLPACPPASASIKRRCLV